MKLFPLIWIILLLRVTPLTAEETGGAMEDSTIERSNIDAPDRTIQVPFFQNGKFQGYIEQPLDPDRKPDSLTVRPGELIEPAPGGDAPPEQSQVVQPE